MYQALYRKYRPRRFTDVAGQEHITETLRRQIIGDRLSHAYLFVGTRGTGKTTCAKVLSRAVNCQNPDDGEPCNNCTACVGIEDGSILDVLELDAASNNKVDDVRVLSDEAIYSPATVKKRVYILDEVHMLTMNASNALLKILEEPPEHILFILATTELHKVPATIQSRCQKFLFKRLSPSTLSARLSFIASSEGLTLTEDAADRLAMLADGSMRDGISLLDQCASGNVIDLTHVQNTLGLAGHQEVSRLIEAIADRNVVHALSILSSLYDDGRDMASLLSEMAMLIRDLLVYKLSPDSGLLNAAFDRITLSAFSKHMTAEQLFYCLDLLKSSISGLPRGGSSRMAVEMCVIKMCSEQMSEDIGALLSRISRLETGVVIGDAEQTPKASDVPLTDVVNAAASDKNTEQTLKIPDVPLTSEQTPKTPDVPLTDVVNPTTDVKNSENPTELDNSEAITADAPHDFWKGILQLISNEPSLYALLSDNSKVQAEQSDSTLIIRVADSWSANMIKSEFLDLLRETARKILGRNVIINVEVGGSGSEESKQSKLDSLSAFGIVNFE